jgi:hypothetical protein
VLFTQIQQAFYKTLTAKLQPQFIRVRAAKRRSANPTFWGVERQNSVSFDRLREREGSAVGWVEARRLRRNPLGMPGN